MTLDAATWGALALTLTVLGGGYTYVAWRRRGVAAGLRGLAWTLVPAALWLTGTLKLAGNIAGDISSWALHLVFSPLVWAGAVLGGVAVLLFGVSGAMLGRGIGVRRAKEPKAAPGKREPKAVQDRRGQDPEDVEGMDDIEAILRKHGIS
jgi:hypothetical protein